MDNLDYNRVKTDLFIEHTNQYIWHYCFTTLNLVRCNTKTVDHFQKEGIRVMTRSKYSAHSESKSMFVKNLMILTK